MRQACSLFDTIGTVVAILALSVTVSVCVPELRRYSHSTVIGLEQIPPEISAFCVRL